MILVPICHSRGFLEGRDFDRVSYLDAERFSSSIQIDGRVVVVAPIHRARGFLERGDFDRVRKRGQASREVIFERGVGPQARSSPPE